MLEKTVEGKFLYSITIKVLITRNMLACTKSWQLLQIDAKLNPPFERHLVDAVILERTHSSRPYPTGLYSKIQVVWISVVLFQYIWH